MKVAELQSFLNFFLRFVKSDILEVFLTSAALMNLFLNVMRSLLEAFLASAVSVWSVSHTEVVLQS